MAHIELNNSAPGILGLFAYKPVSGAAMSALAETILRGPSSLSQGERETIAGVVSYLNECNFCHRSHAAAAEYCLRRPAGYCASVAQNIDSSDQTPKMKALLKIASKVQKSGRAVEKDDVERARAFGAKDEEIHDTVLVAAAFCMYNRYVDGLGTFAPAAEDPFYPATGERLGTMGYVAS